MQLRQLMFAILACALAAAAHARGDAVPSGLLSARNLQLTDFPRWQQLAPGVYAYEGVHSVGRPLDPDKEHINTVSLVVVTAAGVVVIDGQGDAAQSRQMIDFIASLTDQPIRYVVVASDHIDHVGGNAAFKAAFPDVVFIASQASQAQLARDANPPQLAVERRHVLSLGGIDIELLFLGRAHTGGDLVAYLPQSKVLFLGEVYLRGIFPAMRSAYPSEWVEVIEQAQAMDVSWFVPGHGFIDDMPRMRADLEHSRQALVAVIAEARRLHAAGLPCPSAQDCPAARQADWGPYANWAMRDSQAPFAITKVYQELEGKLAPQRVVR